MYQGTGEPKEKFSKFKVSSQVTNHSSIQVQLQVRCQSLTIEIKFKFKCDDPVMQVSITNN